jgi:hypothetical protein
MEVLVESFPPLVALPKPDGPLTPGLKLETPTGRPVTIDRTSNYKWLEQAGVGADQEYRLSGYFEVRLDDIYGFQLRHPDALSVLVDGQALYSQKSGQMDSTSYLPVPLRKGWHKLDVVGKSSAAPRLEMRFGGPGAFRLSRVRFSHD